jgi:5-methylcytosine-specific restriction endonuclease McrA
LKHTPKGQYPENWPEIARKLKDKNNWQCERCFAVNDFHTGHVLTVHHLDGDKSNCADWNLACLCQRCHLHVQGKVYLPQSYMLGHSDWMKPHVEGYYQSTGAQV